MELLLTVWDRVGAPFRFVRGLFTGRVAAEQAANERARQLLRDLAAVMADALAEVAYIGTGYATEGKHQDLGRRAELRAGALATEANDEELRRRVQAFRELVSSIFERTTGGLSMDERRSRARAALEAALERITELQNGLR